MSDPRKVTLSVDDAISITDILEEALDKWEQEGLTNGLLHDALARLIARVDAQIDLHKDDWVTA